MTVVDFKEPPVQPCPVCQREPVISQRGVFHIKGAPAWTAGCYSMQPTEHHVGGGGETRLDAIKDWNTAVCDAAVRNAAFKDEVTERIAKGAATRL